MRSIFKILIFVSLTFFVVLLGLLIFLWPLRFSVQPLLSKSSMSKESANRLEKHVRVLTSINPPRNYSNPESLDEAAEYILTEFQKYSCELTTQEYEVDGSLYQNISCLFSSKNVNESRIVVGAHYDVEGDGPGADDNASGIAGLIELGHMLEEDLESISQPVELVAYTLEEPPYFGTENMGSYRHAQMLYNSDIDVDFMIVLEMIGYFSDEKDSQSYPVSGISLLYPTTGDFITIIGRISDYKLISNTRHSMSKYMVTPVYGGALPRFLPGVDFSDHLNYWDYGYNAVMLTDTAYNRNLNYHETSDTVDTLNYEIMADVVKGLYGFLNFGKDPAERSYRS